jgi:hypothetical protein
MRNILHGVGLCVLLLSSCSKASVTGDATKAGPETASTTSTQAAVGSVPSTSPQAHDPGPLPPPNMASIPERFAAEAKNRPGGTVRVEEVFSAFTQAGVELRETRQHLAGPFEAMYCVGTQAGGDVHMSVCEYKDEPTATNGREMSDKALKAVGRRELVQNKATTLTIRRGSDDASDAALRDKLIGIFLKMTPPSAPAASAPH